MRELRAGIELLTRWESEFGLRADGEAIFPNGDAVCWREWATSCDTILVKNINGVRLSARAACLAMLKDTQA
jgi:phosphoribosyl-dephospho-CoA transferase